MRPVLLALIVCSAAFASPDDSLQFPKDSFTTESKTVKTSAGERNVTYRLYRHITYVAKPVDKDYQSLDISVPVQVDGAAIDARKAPILFRIPVGGYMSARNIGAGSGPRVSRRDGLTSNTDLALAAGYVVVVPGCRGRDNRAASGTYYGKAPAAIVDLKAAVRYLRHNDGTVPGNTGWIVATGVSAGGALTALLGSSGGSRLYDSYLREIGAAEADDTIFAAAPFCPIMDLEHADMAYEWMYGAAPSRSGLVDQDLSRELRHLFAAYQKSLRLRGRDNFGILTADNYSAYLLRTYLYPAANYFLNRRTEEHRREYLAANPWIEWRPDRGARFSFTDFVAHVGRMKGLPAFDDFDLKQPEPSLFGTPAINARHFTAFSLRRATGDPHASLEDGLKTVVNLMNPMYFVSQPGNRGVAAHWWIRQGSSDNHTSLTVLANLAAGLENRKKHVDALLYWDAGHGADQDSEDFVAWIARITGFKSAP